MKKRLFLLVLTTSLFTFSVYAQAKKKSSNDKLIIGKWQMIQMSVDKETTPTKDQNMFFEFTSDGKIITDINGEKSEEAYKVEGNKLVTKLSEPTKEYDDITKITDTELIIQSKSDNSVIIITMERVKNK